MIGAIFPDPIAERRAQEALRQFRPPLRVVSGPVNVATGADPRMMAIDVHSSYIIPVARVIERHNGEVLFII